MNFLKRNWVIKSSFVLLFVIFLFSILKDIATIFASLSSILILGSNVYSLMAVLIAGLLLCVDSVLLYSLHKRKSFNFRLFSYYYLTSFFLTFISLIIKAPIPEHASITSIIIFVLSALLLSIIPTLLILFLGYILKKSQIVFC
ncbi:MAG: hypothetical protein JWP09_733 [Candidatus Taylorbacteria bacterium]|nr:hypothetical protein [Candidatus Taylorbacteria bacterium]